MQVIKELHYLELDFLEEYPNGFEDIALAPMIKKMRTEKISQEVQDLFKKENFVTPELIIDAFVKVCSKSPFISVFDKMKVRDMIKVMSIEQKDMLSIGLYELIHGKLELGFASMLEVLSVHKLAKWTLLTIVPYYFSRQDFYFVKPTTTKEIIKHFEQKNLVYKPRPSIAFYKAYAKFLGELKNSLHKLEVKDNVALTGFLRMSIKMQVIPEE